MKISCKIFTNKGSFRFVFSTFVDEKSFDLAEAAFSRKVRSIFGECMYQIISIEQ